jgi:aminoglycoside 6'-N-acetyltransferase
MAAYKFQPMTEADLPLMRRWLEMPHVENWWGEPDEQFALVSGDIGEPAMQQFIVHSDERPIGYIQSYNPVNWHGHGFGEQPTGTLGIDQFIGELDMVGRGHGSAFIRQFIEQLLAGGAPRIVTDPDPGNARAIRAYQKAGFSKSHLIDTVEGVALLMVRDA